MTDPTRLPAVPDPEPADPAVPDPVEPVTDYTDDGVPTFSYVRDRIEGRAATAAAAEELAGGDVRAAEAQDAFAERERRAAERLAEIRRSMEG
ncbi:MULTISPECIES: hypothetical protein [unclassified Pseudonocardia]|uniref:hypothetical protein n=1 Tax=unclassified Pseudonocardia TaxID=2619320 RepID=UPI001CF685E7|nr:MULTISPECIES: hypothetical protein [unclassified Pseudonocardia]